MPPSVEPMACCTPCDLALPWPALPDHVLLGVAVYADGAAAARYFSKFCVVPDSSDRKKTVILVDGRLAPEFRPLIAGSSQLVIEPWKILAMTDGVRVRSVTPLSLKATATGPVTIGRLSAGPPQRFSAAATSPFFGSRAESEPPMST